MQAIPIQLDKNRGLRVRFSDLTIYENATGDNLLQTIMTNNWSYTSILNLTWVCLRWEDEDLTPDEVATIIQDNWLEKGKNPFDLLKLLVEALKAAGIMGTDGKKKTTTKKPGKPTKR